MRPAAIARSMFMPWSITFMMTWNVVVMIVDPPGAPITMKRRPSGSSTTVGDMDDTMRRSGATRFRFVPDRP